MTKNENNHKLPHLTIQWFHAIDCPVVDPIAIRKAKREKSIPNLTKPNTAADIVRKSTPKNWIPFSKRDNAALEKAYQTNQSSIIPVNEDYLFEVDIAKREISPVYWEGPVFEVRRATWFMQTDSLAKWTPCEESLSSQIEQGYLKRRPYARPAKTDIEKELSQETNKVTSNDTIQKDFTQEQQQEKVDSSINEKTKYVEERENLSGPYSGRYVVYTSPVQAWLLEDTPGAKIAKSFFTAITNHQNLGGINLLRGYQEVKKEKVKKEDEEGNAAEAGQEKPKEEKESIKSRDISSEKQKEIDHEITKQQAEDYDNEESEEELRDIDQVVFVIHGIGQQMSERMGQNFVHDVNVLRKTIKSTWPIAVSGTSALDRPNGIQVLPILWRKSIIFGTDEADKDNACESDLGTVSDSDDGCPTIDEITLEGAPNIRTLVSDVFLDIPLYMTSKYHELMMQVVTKEINRVYHLFIERNPQFLKNNGQVTILAHSLGSLLAFDILSCQPFAQKQKPNTWANFSFLSSESSTNNTKVPSLSFSVKNFFAVGSPLGMILLLRSNKIVSRKTLDRSPPNNDNKTLVTFVYPAADNIYNIFHKSDPVAYRLEPLVARHYGSQLKPMPIPYIKGGLKRMLDASFHVGNDLANRAGAMFESFKSGFTSSLIMRGLGFSNMVAMEGSAQQETSSDLLNIVSKEAAKSAVKLQLLNPHYGRLDFCLQEGLLENAYLSALSVHMSYWQDVDVAGFLIREIYRTE